MTQTCVEKNDSVEGAGGGWNRRGTIGPRTLDYQAKIEVRGKTKQDCVYAMVTTTYQILINNYKEMPPNYTVVEILNMVLFSLVFQMSDDSPS